MCMCQGLSICRTFSSIYVLNRRIIVHMFATTAKDVISHSVRFSLQDKSYCICREYICMWYVGECIRVYCYRILIAPPHFVSVSSAALFMQQHTITRAMLIRKNMLGVYIELRTAASRYTTPFASSRKTRYNLSSLFTRSTEANGPRGMVTVSLSRVANVATHLHPQSNPPVLCSFDGLHIFNLSVDSRGYTRGGYIVNFKTATVSISVYGESSSVFRDQNSNLLYFPRIFKICEENNCAVCANDWPFDITGIWKLNLVHTQT